MEGFLEKVHEQLNIRVKTQAFSLVICPKGVRSAEQAEASMTAKGPFLLSEISPQPTSPDEYPIALPQPPSLDGQPVQRSPVGFVARPPIRFIERSPRHFYRDTFSGTRQQKLDFSCKDLMHHGPPERLTFSIIPDEKAHDGSNGRIECRVMAKNLSEPVFVNVDLSLTFTHGDAFQFAKDLIENTIR